MKFIVFTLVLLICNSVFADSRRYTDSELGKELILVEVEGDQKLEFKHEKVGIDNELQIIVDGNIAFTLSLPGPSTWYKGLLAERASILQHVYDVNWKGSAALACESKKIVVTGYLEIIPGFIKDFKVINPSTLGYSCVK